MSDTDNLNELNDLIVWVEKNTQTQLHTGLWKPTNSFVTLFHGYGVATISWCQFLTFLSALV